MPYSVSRCESVAGCSGRPAFWPGNSQRPAAEMTAAWSAGGGCLAEQRGEGLGNADGRVSQAQERGPGAVGGDVVCGEPGDAGCRLGEQQDQQARGPGPDRAGAVSECAADQGEALFLADGLGARAGCRVGGQLQAGQESLGHGEAEEAGGHLGGGAAGGGVPAVQAGLGEAGRADPGCLEPVAERLAAGERAGGIPGGAGDQGSRRGGAQPRQQAKCRIPAQYAQVRVPGQRLQPVMQPGFEDGKVRITIGQDPGAGEQVPQVTAGLPVRPGRQRLVGELEGPGRQRGEQVECGTVAQPGQAGAGPGHCQQRLAQRQQGRGDAAGAVVEDQCEPFGQRAPFADLPAGQQPFDAAPAAGEVAGDAGAVPADRRAAGQPGQQPGRAAARAAAPDAGRPPDAGPADPAVRPGRGGGHSPVAADAASRRHGSRVTRLGRGGARPETGSGRCRCRCR